MQEKWTHFHSVWVERLHASIKVNSQFRNLQKQIHFTYIGENRKRSWDILWSLKAWWHFAINIKIDQKSCSPLFATYFCIRVESVRVWGAIPLITLCKAQHRLPVWQYYAARRIMFYRQPYKSKYQNKYIAQSFEVAIYFTSFTTENVLCACILP